MTVEEILDNMDREIKNIEKSLSTIKELRCTVASAQTQDWDWISVAEAARDFRISQGFIYARIKSGEIKSSRLGSRMLVRASEVKALFK